MIRSIAAAAILTLAGHSAGACVLSQEKVSNLYNGAAPESVEFQTGCKPELVSSNGYGPAAVNMYQIVDARGSILVIMANGDHRMTGFSVQLAR